MDAAPLPLLCCNDYKKLEMAIVSGDARESHTKEVESKWLKGGFLTYMHEGT